MADIDDNSGVFDGINGLKSDAFIRNIRRRMLADGAHKDDELTAQTAASYLGGPAMEWYEDQPGEVQDDWKLLRRAILLRWPPEGSAVAAKSPSAYAPASPPAKAPTPAAAPPSRQSSTSSSLSGVVLQSGPKTGKIKVLSDSMRPLGYVSHALNHHGHHFLVTNRSEGITVRPTPVGRLYDIQIMTPTMDNALGALGMTWTYPPAIDELAKGITTWGSITRLSGPLWTRNAKTSSNHFSGPSGSDIWTVTMDGMITASWETTPGFRRDLSVTMSDETGAIILSNDYVGYAKNWSSVPVQVFLQFEPSSRPGGFY